MAGFAKGMATTSGWTLVPCDCRNRIHQVSQRQVVRARRRWRPQPAHGGFDIHYCTRESIEHDAGDGNIFFPSVDAAARRTVKLLSGARVRLRHSSCKSTTGFRPADLINNYQILRVCVWMCEIQVQVTTMTVSLPGDIIGAKGG